MEKKKTITLKIPNLNWWMVSTLILLVVLVVSLSQGFGFTGQMSKTLSKDVAAAKAADYINNNLVRPGTSIEVVSTEEESGLYKVITLYQGQDIPVYITKDGSMLFLQGFDLNKKQETTTTQQQKATSCEDLPKADKPILEAYVVSYCPFGTQMQRILSKIVDEIPSLADNIKVRYMGSISNDNITSMHGEKEAQENLRQICIREEQSNKYWKYLENFLKDGDYESALQTAGIDTTKLENCMSDPNKGLKYAKEDFDLNDKYSITGSPTLILNGEHVSEFDFGGRTAQAVKTVLCCGFSTQPSQCAQNLTIEQAATGFSETYSGSSGTGSC